MLWQRWHCRHAVVLVLGHFLLAALAPPAEAQRTRNSDVLNATYFQGLITFRSGDYADAAGGFRDAGRAAIRVGEIRWIDSISYHAMTGESYYQLGQMPQALEHFGSALQLYLQNADWMQQVQFPPRIAPRTAAVGPVPWGQSQRRFRLGQFPEKFNITRGRSNISVVGNQTIIQPGEMLMTIHAPELVRTTALAVRRRRELLGPVAASDRLLQDVVARMATKPGQNGSISAAWLDVQVGVGYAAIGRKEQAITALTRSLVVDGDCDHPLTGLALLELARLAADKGDVQAAMQGFAEATYSGFYFSQPEVIEDALREATALHIQSGGKGIYPPLAAAAEWGRMKRLATLQATASLCVAENAITGGDARQISTGLAQAMRAIPRKELAMSRLGARLNYVTALANQQRQPKVAEPALAAAMAWQRKGSLRLFQMAMVDQFYHEGVIRDREALELFAKALDEPSAADWRRDPMEAITVLLAPQEGLLGNWLDAAMAREDWRMALEVCDRIRRQRFYSTLPLGGRLMSLRWILEAPESALPPAAVLQRKDLLARYAAYRQLTEEAGKLRKALQELPPMPEEREQVAKQAEILNNLARIHANQDGMLKEMALSREPAAMVFPPQRPLAEVEKSLQPGQALLVFQSTGKSLYGFLVTPSRIGAWKVASPEGVRKRLVTLLRAMGHFDQNREVETTLLTDPTWRGEAAGLLKEIFLGSRIDIGQGIQELVVIPDDFLWYVPFEALQIGAQNKTENLISRMRIRYAPTIGLAVADHRPRRQAGATGVIVGHVFPHEPEELATNALQRLKKAMPQAAAISKLPAAAAPLFIQRLNSLLVLDDLGGAEEGNYQQALLRLDRGRPGSRLEEWLGYPPTGPEVVALPGFHTPAENALKKLPRAGRPGDELFFTSCALMATGSRTVLLSRWRTGGSTCNQLLLEWLPELANTSASDAWQRAVELARQTPLDLSLEPRVKSSKDKDGDSLHAEHPFFWAGYLLVDTGTDPKMKPAEGKPAGPAPVAPAAPGAAPPPGVPAAPAPAGAEPAAEQK